MVSKGDLAMFKKVKLILIGCCIVVITRPLFAADPDHGEVIAKRWCSSCHLVERGQTSVTDQAPPFKYIARIPEFDANKLAFLLFRPHPNMPELSLSRAEVGDLASYIKTLD